MTWTVPMNAELPEVAPIADPVQDAAAASLEMLGDVVDDLVDGDETTRRSAAALIVLVAAVIAGVVIWRKRQADASTQPAAEDAPTGFGTAGPVASDAA